VRSIVGDTDVDLWYHVWSCANLGLKKSRYFFARSWGRETEINKDDVVVFRDNDVIWLDISVT
jgi:hypothetical protein